MSEKGRKGVEYMADNHVRLQRLFSHNTANCLNITINKIISAAFADVLTRFATHIPHHVDHTILWTR